MEIEKNFQWKFETIWQGSAFIDKHVLQWSLHKVASWNRLNSDKIGIVQISVIFGSGTYLYSLLLIFSKNVYGLHDYCADGTPFPSAVLSWELRNLVCNGWLFISGRTDLKSFCTSHSLHFSINFRFLAHYWMWVNTINFVFTFSLYPHSVPCWLKLLWNINHENKHVIVQ